MLPTPNSQKARSLAVWIVQSQRLPVGIINDEKTRHSMCAGIATVLMRSDSACEVTFRDALKVI